MPALAKKHHVEQQPAGEWLSPDEAAALIGITDRSVRYRCAEEFASAAKMQRTARAIRVQPPGHKECWRILRSWCHRLRFEHATSSKHRLLEKYGDPATTHGNKKLWCVKAFEDRRAHRKAGETDVEIVADICRLAKARDHLTICPRTLWRWIKAKKAGGAEALIDRRMVKTPDEQSRSANAVEFFYDCYRVRSQPSIRVCHDMTFRESRKSGWQWPASVQATTQWLRRHDDRSLTCLLREGQHAWASRYLPHCSIDYSNIDPAEMYLADHHQCDFWVSHRAEQIRPWLTSVMDAKTRCIVGWHLGASPHQDAILAALRMAFVDWAIPGVVKIDNGKDFASRLIAGVTRRERDQLRRELGGDWQRILRRDRGLVECTDNKFMGIAGELGIKLIFATPYAPWSKGILERFFGSFADQCSKTFSTYCGNSAAARPECLTEIRRGYTDQEKRRLRKLHGKDWKRIAVLKFVDQSAVPTMKEATDVIRDWIDLYHRTGHQFDDRFNVIPLECWQTASRLRRAVENELLLLMDGRGVYRVSANGVSFKAGAMKHSYGGNCVALKPYIGREVFITLDPADLSHCFAFTTTAGQKRRFIARLDSNEKIPPHSAVEAERAVIAGKKREQAVMQKARRSEARRFKTVAQRLREHNQERLAELRATGTDGRRGTPNIIPVDAGFDVCSIHDQRSFENAADGDDETDFTDFFKPEEADEAAEDETDFSDLFKPDQPADDFDEADDEERRPKENDDGGLDAFL